MAYARYFKRGSKRYGPYYYTTIRTPDGKVKSIYVGRKPLKEKKPKKTRLKKNPKTTRNKQSKVRPIADYTTQYSPLTPKFNLSLSNIRPYAQFIFIILIAAIIGILLVQNPTITGFATGITEEYTQQVGLEIAQPQNYSWEIPEHPDAFYLNSIKLSGHIIGNGSVKAYLSDGNNTYQILDSDNLGQEINPITAFAIAISGSSISTSNSGGDSGGSTSESSDSGSSDSGSDLSAPSETSADISSSSESSADTSSSVTETSISEETTTGTSAGTETTTEVTEETTSEVPVETETTTETTTSETEEPSTETATETPLIEEQTTNETINETISTEETNATETQNQTISNRTIGNLTVENATEDNITLQNITLQNATISNITSNLTEQNITQINETNITIQNITTQRIDFSGVCVETCILPEGLFNETNYTFVFEVENGTILVLDSIEYTLTPVEANLTNATYVFEADIKDADNESIPAIVEIKKSDTGEIEASDEITQDEINTISSQETQQLGGRFGAPKKHEKAKKKPINLNISKGTYDIVVKPKNNPVQEIDFENIEINNNVTTQFNIDDAPETGTGFVEVYAIDPTQFNFTSATVTVTAKGNSLYKCKDWNFTAQTCYGNWTFIQSITPGQQYTFTLTPEDPGFAELQAQNCSAEDNSTKGAWDSSCDNSYPGNALNIDDTTYETHSYVKDGSNYLYAGVKITSYNSSISNCENISSVEICYKWWCGGGPYDCDISVDADGDNSWTAVTTTCPGTSEPANITCTDVTSLENWTCSNFFGASGTRAQAKSEITQQIGSLPPSPKTATWDVLFFNVTYNESINNPPTVSNVVLSSTSGNNLTTDNLTVTYDVSDPDNDPVKNITNWYKDAISITKLNMPFEGGSNSTYTKDYSGHGNDGIVNGSTWNSTGGYDGKGAYEFDGVNDIINVPDSTLWDLKTTDNITIEAWIKLASTIPGTYANIWGDWNGPCVQIYRTGGNDYLIWYAGSSVSQSNAITLTPGTWYHIVVVKTAQTNVTFYQNAVNVGNVTPSDVNVTPNSITIGADEGGEYFNGTIDEVRIYNKSLSEEQIKALYQNKTDLIVSQETSVGDTWKACITPNDGTVDGTEVCSNNLTIVSDATPPLISLISPANNTEDLDGTILFEYNTTDPETTVSSCKLIINGAVDQTNNNITEGVTQNFTKTGMSSGTYSWNINCTSEGGENSSEIRNFTIKQAIFEDNFTSAGGFQNDSDNKAPWERGNATQMNGCHSSPSCWGTNLTGNSYSTGPYDDFLTQVNAMDFTNYTNITLTFYHYRYFEDASTLWDAGVVDINYNGSWTRLTPEGGYSGTVMNTSSSSLANQQAYGYHSSDWELATFNLTPYAGNSNVTIRFYFAADEAGNDKGWFIDDVRVTGDVASIDNPPTTNLVSPANGNVTTSNNVTFTCNATDDNQLANISLYVWNSTTQYYTNTTTISGTANQTSWTLTSMPNDNYTWNCLAYDNASQSDWGDANWSVVVNYTAPVCTLSLSTSTLDFGTVAPNTNTGANNRLLTINNTGTADATNTTVRGTNWSSGANNFLVNYTKYDISNVTYASLANYLTSTDTALQNGNISAGGYLNTYWGLAVPDAQAADNYNQTITFTMNC